MKQCNHARKGIVTNQDPGKPHDRARAHAGRAVCDRAPCIAAAENWVEGKTKERAYYYSDAERGIG